jgi:hypothetical protein
MDGPVKKLNCARLTIKQVNRTISAANEWDFKKFNSARLTIRHMEEHSNPNPNMKGSNYFCYSLIPGEVKW